MEEGNQKPLEASQLQWTTRWITSHGTAARNKHLINQWTNQQTDERLKELIIPTILTMADRGIGVAPPSPSYIKFSDKVSSEENLASWPLAESTLASKPREETNPIQIQPPIRPERMAATLISTSTNW